MKLHLIGLAGRARSGKDTAANVLVHEFGYERIAFADALKEAAAVMLGLPLERMHDGDREAVMPQWGFSIRTFLQRLGTECVRNQFGHDFWIKALRERMHARMHATGQNRFVVSDVRFDNEATWVRSAGGRVLHIERPGVEALDHASEKGVWRFDQETVLQNSGTLAEFEQKVSDWHEGAAA